MQVTSALKRRFASSTTIAQSYSCDLQQTFKFPLRRLEDVPVTVFRCSERRRAADAADLGWGAYCGRLRVTPVPGNHESVLLPPHLDALRQAFVTAVTGA